MFSIVVLNLTLLDCLVVSCIRVESMRLSFFTIYIFSQLIKGKNSSICCYAAIIKYDST